VYWIGFISNEPVQINDRLGALRVKLQSGRDVGHRATIYHSHLDVIAVDAFEFMLFNERTYRRDIAEEH
jgi:hypothetical protein